MAERPHAVVDVDAVHVGVELSRHDTSKGWEDQLTFAHCIPEERQTLGGSVPRHQYQRPHARTGLEDSTTTLTIVR
jgi:hypothetical protein